jgi:hypothetical protein
VDIECKAVSAQVGQLPQSAAVGRDGVDLTAAREGEQPVLDGRGRARGPLLDLEGPHHERDADRDHGEGKRSDEGAAGVVWTGGVVSDVQLAVTHADDCGSHTRLIRFLTSSSSKGFQGSSDLDVVS